MPNTLAQVEAFAATHQSPHQGGTWNQLCEQFINNAGAFSQAFATAVLAGNASGYLDPDHTTAEDGEIHYWSGAGDGHDAFQTSRGLLCASNAIAGYLGYISFATFTVKKPSFRYRGHTFRHGTQTLAGVGTSTAGTDTVTPVTPPASTAKKEDVMYVKGSAAQIYVIYTDPNGKERLRLANTVEGQLATASGALIVCSDTQLTQLGAESGWVGGAVTPPPLPKVDADVSVDLTGIATTAQLDTAEQTIIKAIPTTFKASA